MNLAEERGRTPRALRGIETPKDQDPLRSEGLAAEASEAVAIAPLPAAIVEITSGRIMAASPPMREMFASGGGTVLGRTVDEFMTDPPSGALDLLRAGRLQGYVTTRLLRRRQEQPMPVQVWVRALGTDTPPRFAVAVFATSLTRTGALLPEVARSDLTPVVGTSDESLLIDRISSDVEALLGYRPSDLLGRSILSLVTDTSVPGLLGLLAHAAATGAGVTLNLVACSKQGDPVLLEAVLWPLRPPPRCGFALLPGAYAESAFGTAADVENWMSRYVRDSDAVSLSRHLATTPHEGDLTGLSRLTTRELEIVRRLVSGDRVPSIAKALFLSPSTVRNHLHSIYRKLDVHSQQELIHAFRRGSALR
ncbi:MAG: LuxR C-terminal-related transcriptional regulator [Candidatus Dormiibacterota bacterium]